jgi:hypothetical protein
MIEIPPWQDIVLAFGGLVGLTSKAYALYDTDTTWSRMASIPNALFFIPTILAFASLGLWYTTATSFLSMLIWFSIGIWRAPENEEKE